MNWRLFQQVLPTPAEIPDAELLRRYATQADHVAFAGLVTRHGRLVWSICRSRCSREADAEDAFQATFLALIRAAPTFVVVGSIGPWLCKTAHRVVNKCLVSSARRAKREARAAIPEADHRPTECDWERTTAALHEELAELSEPLRQAFVVCVLEGASLQEASTQLGWKPGTVSGRLTRAKDELERRLLNRGLVPVVVAGLTLGSGVLARVPEQLMTQTLTLTTSGATIPATILTLLPQGTMLMKWKLLAAALILVTGLGTTASMWQGQAEEPKPPVSSEKAPDKAVEASQYWLERARFLRETNKKAKPPFMYYIPSRFLNTILFERVINTRADGKIPAEYEFLTTMKLSTDRLTAESKHVVTEDPKELETWRVTEVMIFRRKPEADAKQTEAKLMEFDLRFTDSMHAERVYVAQPRNQPSQAEVEAVRNQLKGIQEKATLLKDTIDIEINVVDFGINDELEFAEIILNAGKSHFASKWLVTSWITEEEERSRRELKRVVDLIARSAQPEKAELEASKKELEAHLQELKEKPRRILILTGPRSQIEWMDKLILSLKTKVEKKK
ncbi:MAG: RNA polymerase sigma factor [Fimbriiglobus sp.]